jgi:hypothetical protein
MTLSATVMLASASIAACGSSGPTAAKAASRATQASAHTPGLAYARCMRAHGVTNFPDPSASGGFNLNAAGINQSAPAVKAAETACKHLLPVKRPPDVQPTAAAYRRLLHWVKCMRTHGIPNMPDPKPDPVPGPNSPGSNRFGTLMGDGGYWVGIPINVNAHSSAFAQLSARCGEPVNGHHG